MEKAGKLVYVYHNLRLLKGICEFVGNEQPTQEGYEEEEEDSEEDEDSEDEDGEEGEGHTGKERDEDVTVVD